MTQIDFLASQPHYLDHIAPIWDTLPDDLRGTFYVPNVMLDYAVGQIKHRLYLIGYEDNGTVESFNRRPALVSSYGDMMHIHQVDADRKILMMEHGTGHTFHSSAYPDGKGKRDWVDMFLSPNQYTVDRIHTVRQTRCEVIGTPKTDRIVQEINTSKLVKQEYSTPPTIAIGFHWGSKRNNPPESGSAWEHYKDILPTLSKKYNLIGYGHPLARGVYKPAYESMGIEYVETLWEVFNRADILINDLSSAMYEFLCTGKPVIVLNAPWFRREVQHGIRFWDYSDIGSNVENPEDLDIAIETTLLNYSKVCIQEREKTITDLYPYLGESAKQAADVIAKYLENLNGV